MLTTCSKCSQKVRCPLRRRQARDSLKSPADVRKGASHTIHLPVINILKLHNSPDRSRTPNPLQPRHRPCKNLHFGPLQTHLPRPPTTRCPLDRRRLRSLLLHSSIFRTTNPVSTRSSCLGSHYSKSNLHPRKHHVYCYWLFQCLH